MLRLKIKVLVIVGLVALLLPNFLFVSANTSEIKTNASAQEFSENSENKISTTVKEVDAIVNLVNESRIEQGLQPLQINPLLAQSAQLKAQDMVENGYFAHVSPEGINPWHWFVKAGYEYEFAAENLAVNFTDPKVLVDAWMKSPTHRKNILNKDYTEIGISIMSGTHKGKTAAFVVQHFGTTKNF